MNSGLPTPDAPLVKRVGVAALMLVTMPLWWPVFVGLFFIIWLLMGVIIALMCVIMLLMPIMALKGIEPDTTTKFEVEVENDRVGEFLALSGSIGADVEEK